MLNWSLASCIVSKSLAEIPPYALTACLKESWIGSMSLVGVKVQKGDNILASPIPQSLTVRSLWDTGELLRMVPVRRVRLIGSNSLWGNQKTVHSVDFMSTYMQVHTHKQRERKRTGWREGQRIKRTAGSNPNAWHSIMSTCSVLSLR